MEHARSVLHLFPSCVALKNKLETVNETRNREQWRHAFYDFVGVVKKLHETVLLSGPTLGNTFKGPFTLNVLLPAISL